MKNLVEHYADQVISTNQTYQPMDRTYLINYLYHLVGEGNVEGNAESGALLETVSQLINVAIQNHQIDDTLKNRELLEAELTNLYTPLPSTVNERFWNLYHNSPEQATDYFYQLSQQNNYIKTERIKKNLHWDTATKFGDLEITINLSKPEKDPNDIAKAGQNTHFGYPECNLCAQTEGYYGNAQVPVRVNHRIIDLLIGGRPWGFQYSPYAYFDQHCIFLDDVHEPMKISAQTFSNLIEIVQMFPTYFVGSNADLPIVGGSILSHEHYQGGYHTFPMMKANTRFTFTVNGYPDVKAEVLNWPMSTIRLTSKDTHELIYLATHILNEWRKYSDPSVAVRAETNGTPHHTVTPIVRMNNQGQFEVYVVLRDNQTSAKYPDGIFHPHAEYQHIKKENIGLIEVMGRAILPARLKSELVEVKKDLLGQPNDIADYHVPWAKQLKQNYNLNPDNVQDVIDKEVGITFMHVLENAGVFKLDDKGTAAFHKFIDTL
ncbi:UDP-glucose--hexose-1-phosphate uridylyltransferase [Fructilactobacillus fructivorans]|uniref:Galactose-1-phosphate uridylyltransferase n=1 Tax=Fructilactobacillus fructivorans TaxID=1614 RepID=A0A0C1Q3E2_9LACO|nr:UDP-glucose--hexose-1-phosphate uridylyltransferase [Fructilactobacillus fructivorans]KID42398.1 Galactose-1-phosphate uridylyltransferase [Fructilactobacillus fructivorans]MCT0150987.1 UDP-glucose--hexose-1-phosphate uridylyltransferase [Fructilactobacillus fructivorans]MCT2867456.1 UDP-glucose--hexose-1-phosphate uridylyltransferase [Fructilactobacillus fructivorans]MCT2869026.1 UDP-glucose--hexose-1-phosphate uridylyltransferase [Fructilactobacillus fructivorans]MCT2873255.1 UDP-glucose-